MAYQRYLAQMTLRHIEYGDSFPERHVADLDDLKLVSDEDCGSGSGGYGGSSAASDSTAVSVSSRSCRAPSRPPRAPSESPDGYEMRGRYWEAADVLRFDLEESKKAPDVWDYVYDPVCLPPPSASSGASPMMMRTPAIRQLGAMPIRRAWRRRSSRERPNVRREPVVEAIMMYERGEVLDRVGRCSRCSEGKGISRECVVVSPRLSSGNGVDACSNCLYDGLGDSCDALQRCSYRRLSRKRSRSDGKDKDEGKGEGGEGEGINSGPRREDYITVLKLIEQVKNNTGAGTAGAGSKKDQSVVAKAKRIEEAALQVARAAREWGRREREAPSKSK